MEEPIFATKYFGSKLKTYKDYLEWTFPLMSPVIIPKSSIASISGGVWGTAGITIETSGGKKYLIPVNSFKNGLKRKIIDLLRHQ